jgi:hypothetical protein
LDISELNIHIKDQKWKVLLKDKKESLPNREVSPEIPAIHLGSWKMKK